MNATNTTATSSVGKTIERALEQLPGARPHPDFDDLADVRNLAGDSTGYVRVLQADRIAKASSLSLDIAPGLRYFNIHVIPEPHYDVPRFLYEGMVSPDASQLSMDLFPDVDIVMHIGRLKEAYRGIDALFERAKADDQLPLGFSRLSHMRAIATPWFIVVRGLPDAMLGRLDELAQGYYREWLAMHNNAAVLPAGEAEARQQRRDYLGRTVVEMDPDRHLVVSVYGEEMTQAIERATIF